MRKELFPSFQGAYQTWITTNDLKPLKRIVATGAKHWASLANDMLDCHTKEDGGNLKKLEAIVQKNIL